MKETLCPGFVWTFEVVDNETGEVRDSETVHNIMPTEGLNHMLATELKGGAQVANWYVGVYEGAYTPVATDTMATFPANATECTTYAGATRPALTLGAIANGAVDNFAATTDFAFNAMKTVYGGFVSSSSAKGGTAGFLLSAVRAASAKLLDDTSTLRVKVSFTMVSI
jgi:hypothetical protein